MAILAHLKFGNNALERYEKEYLAISVTSKFSREYSGIRPGSAIRCIIYTVEVIAPESVDLDLYGWYIDDESREGCIEMEETLRNDSIHRRTLKFENARCYSLIERYDITERHRRRLLLEFSATSTATEGLQITCQKRIV